MIWKLRKEEGNVFVFNGDSVADRSILGTLRVGRRTDSHDSGTC